MTNKTHAGPWLRTEEVRAVLLDFVHDTQAEANNHLDRSVHVESWNEWGKLRHVIVGVADNSCIPPAEPAFLARLSQDSDLRGRFGPRSAESVAQANAELDAFADLLMKKGVRVDRPVPLDFCQAVCTPDFEQDSMFGCMAPRDVLITIGREILEATMSFRSRFFEYLCYRPLLERYFEKDQGMRHESAPRPRLTSRSYRLEYMSEGISRAERQQWVHDRKFATTDIEVIFEAADIMRCGKDLFVQHGFTTNARGIEWLRRHFPDLRIHAMNFPGDPFPAHIDCSLVPLRPGLVLINPQRPPCESQLKIFHQNDWQVIDAAPPAHDCSPPLCYSSPWLSMNVLSLDEKTVFVEASEVHQMDQLDRLGFDVVPVQLRNAYPFGGGLHCATTDIWREGDLVDLFPVQ